VIDSYSPTDLAVYLERRRKMKRVLEDSRPLFSTRRGPMWPIAGGARQYLADGPYIDPPVSAPLSANTSTSAVDMWTGATYTPIFANDPKAGKIYVVEAGGIISTGASGTLTITPFYGTSSGVALGASAAQTVAINLSNVPWYLRFVVVFRVIGAAGANSTVTCSGVFYMSGTLATAGSGCAIPFGSTSTTSTSVDATVNKDITIQKTLSVAGSFSTNYAYIASLN
jgi:hypothetical protein